MCAKTALFLAPFSRWTLRHKAAQRRLGGSMICPHCKQDTMSFRRLYRWPYGVKICPSCNGTSKVKSRPLLTMASLGLGILSGVPAVVFGNLLYFVPSILIALAIDYAMDKKYRELVRA